MRRREFLGVLGGTAAVWPLVAGAQQQAMPVIGYLSSASPAPFAPMVAALRRGLSEAGVVEGKDFVIEYQWAEGQYDRLPTLAADFVRRQVATIVATAAAVRRWQPRRRRQPFQSCSLAASIRSDSA